MKTLKQRWLTSFHFGVLIELLLFSLAWLILKRGGLEQLELFAVGSQLPGYWAALMADGLPIPLLVAGVFLIQIAFYTVIVFTILTIWRLKRFKSLA